MTRPFGGIYETMKFPPYRYAEYPKAVRAKDGTIRRAANLAEETKILLEEAPEGETRESVESERDRLAAKLAAAEKALAEERAKNSLGTAGTTAPKVGPVGTVQASKKA